MSPFASLRVSVPDDQTLRFAQGDMYCNFAQGDMSAQTRVFALALFMGDMYCNFAQGDM